MNGAEPMVVEVPWEQLAPDTLQRLIEEFVSREGTDYGHQTPTLEAKVDRVMAQLRRGDAVVTFDSRVGTATIVSAIDRPR